MCKTVNNAKYFHFLTFRIQNKPDFEPYHPDNCEALAVKQVCVESNSQVLTIKQFEHAAIVAINRSGYNEHYVEALIIGAICVENTDY